MERVVSLVKMARMESLDHKDCKVCLDQWEHQVIKVPWVNRASKVILVYLVHKDLVVIQEKMEYQVIVALQVLLAPLVTEEPVEVLDQEVSKVCQDPLVKMGWQEEMENLDFRAHQV